MVQEGGEMPLAVTKNCGLVGVHPQVLPIPAVISAFLESASSITVPPVRHIRSFCVLFPVFSDQV